MKTSRKALALTILGAMAGGAAAQGPGATVALDDTAFINELPKSVYLLNARTAEVEWLFNDTALSLGTRANLEAKAQIPEAGTYHIFVRSGGTDRTSFRIAANGKHDPTDFGKGPMAWKKGGTFTLEKGEATIRITRIAEGGTVDAVALTKNEGMTEEDLKKFQYGPDTALIKDYETPNITIAQFGDLDGDKRMDFLAMERDFSATAYNHDGKALWTYRAPEEGARQRSGFEAPALVWDLDGDGASEAIHWRTIDGKETLTAADGKTGEIKFKADWPTPPMPHEYNNFRLAIGKVAADDPESVFVHSDTGGRISVACYDNKLNKRWEHVENFQKDHLGHYPYPIDVDGDGADEVFMTGLRLNAKGEKVWDRFDEFYDNHDHADSMRFGDITGDGKPEMLIPNSEYGVVVMNPANGEILWTHMCEHTQQLEWGNFIKGAAGPQLAANARTYGLTDESGLSGQVWWFDPKGTLLSKWPGKPLNGNPDFVKGDWEGKGTDALFWHHFRLGEDGTGKIYFSDAVFHMLDFLGDKAEEVVTIEGGHLRIWGYAKADHAAALGARDYAYKKKIANHTHY